MSKKDLFVRDAMMAVLRSYPANKYASYSEEKDTGDRAATVAYYAAIKAWELYSKSTAEGLSND